MLLVEPLSSPARSWEQNKFEYLSCEYECSPDKILRVSPPSSGTTIQLSCKPWLGKQPPASYVRWRTQPVLFGVAWRSKASHNVLFSLRRHVQRPGNEDFSPWLAHHDAWAQHCSRDARARAIPLHSMAVGQNLPSRLFSSSRRVDAVTTGVQGILPCTRNTCVRST